jgi:hypothetical protein
MDKIKLKTGYLRETERNFTFFQTGKPLIVYR